MRRAVVLLLGLAVAACKPALAVERATGHLSASAADAEGAFVLAGSCIAE